MNPETVKTAIAALENERRNLQTRTMVNGLPQYETEVAAIDAAARWLDTIAAGQWTPMPATGWPHSEGYFAFEGRVLGLSVGNVQWVVRVKTNSIDRQYYASSTSGLSHKVTDMIGTWTKLHMPWDAPQADVKE